MCLLSEYGGCATLLPQVMYRYSLFITNSYEQKLAEIQHGCRYRFIIILNHSRAKRTLYMDFHRNSIQSTMAGMAANAKGSRYGGITIGNNICGKTQSCNLNSDIISTGVPTKYGTKE